VGLINLGNTCYMNSVIQALYNTHRFRHLVLASDPAGLPVLASLQQVFLFLQYSHRNIFSPSEFLRLARPPWFEAGRQQDCSEFLTFLLDSLKEEEEAVGPRRGEAAEGATVTEVVEMGEVEEEVVIEEVVEREHELNDTKEEHKELGDIEEKQSEKEEEGEEEMEEARDSLGVEGLGTSRGSRSSLTGSRGSGLSGVGMSRCNPSPPSLLPFSPPPLFPSTSFPLPPSHFLLSTNSFPLLLPSSSFFPFPSPLLLSNPGGALRRT